MNADGPTDGGCHHWVSVHGAFATPEIRGLFEEWAKAVEEEIVTFLKEKGSSEPSDIAVRLKISEESALFFIGKMAREKKIKITGIKAEG